MSTNPPLFTQISCPVMDQETSFFLAIKNNNLEIVEKLLSTKSVDVDHKFAPENKPAVFLAVESGHRDIVSCLVRYGCSVNQCDRRGDTPLHQAVRDRRKDLIEILLKERAKITVLNSDRINSIHLAVYLRCLDVVKLLLAPQTDSTLTNEMILSLIFRGHDSSNSEYLPPFSLACSKGYDEIVQFFLSLMDDTTAKKFFHPRRSTETSTLNPYHYVLRLEEDTVKALIPFFPAPEFLISSREDYMKWSPLHRLAQADTILHGKSGRMATILIVDGSAPVDVRDLNGRTPLHLAIMRKNHPVIESLLRAGCRTDIADSWGNTPLQYVIATYPADYPCFYLICQFLDFGLDLYKERWLTVMFQRSPPVSDPVLEFLYDLRRSGFLINLKNLCRKSIRQHLRARADGAIRELDCLPESLKAFLLVEE